MNLNKLDTTKPILIAFSAGPDSMYLLHKLSTITPKPNLVLIYCNHNLRPNEVTKEIQLTSYYATKFGFPFIVTSCDLEEVVSKNKISIETAGRHYRYDELKKAAKRYGISTIMTAHHLDDHCETFMSRIIRGSKSHLGGIPYKRQLDTGSTIIRPLLDTSKRDILAYLEEHGLEYSHDSSNELDVFTRNKIRQSIMPTIEAINPNYRERMCETMAYLKEIHQYLDRQLEPFLTEVESDSNLKKIRIDLLKFKALDRVLQSRLLFKVISTGFNINNDVSDKMVQSKHIELVLNLISEKKDIQSKTIDFPDNTRCRVTNEKIVIEFKSKDRDETVLRDKKDKSDIQISKIPGIYRIKWLAEDWELSILEKRNIN